jgi:hypothetical protein
MSQAAWYMPIILALRRHRQEDLKFKIRLGYIARLCLQKAEVDILSPLYKDDKVETQRGHVASLRSKESE